MFRRGSQGTSLARRSEAGLAPWNPWQTMSEMQRQMDDIFGRAFGFAPLSRVVPEVGQLEPSTDIYETPDKVIAVAVLPGFEPEAVSVEATEDSLTIQGERKALFEDDKAVVHRQGWQSGAGSFSVSYSLPADINPSDVKAAFRNGILRIEMPKAEHARPKSVKVNVSAGS
jgi:HSP20 family protein